MTTPLDQARNLGPVSSREFAALGVHTLERLCELGWEEACLLWVERYPARINLNAFTSVIGAIQGVAWNEINPADRQRAKVLIAELRRRGRS